MSVQFSKGDPAIVTCGDRTIRAEVVMISPNQVSVLIQFDAVLGGHIGMMPAMRHDKDLGIYRSIIDGTEFTMRKPS